MSAISGLKYDSFDVLTCSTLQTIPKLSTAQITALQGVTNGCIVYDTTTNQFKIYISNAWQVVSVSGSGTGIYVLKSGDSMSGTLNMSSNAITDANVLTSGNGSLTNPTYSYSAFSNCGHFMYDNNTVGTATNGFLANKISPSESVFYVDVKSNNSFYADFDGNDGGYYMGNSSNHGTYRSVGTNNVHLFTTAGELNMETIASGTIKIIPAGTSAFQVKTNTGGFTAFQVYSTGLNSVAANVIGYSAIMQPLNSGRFVLPYFSSAPSGPAYSEIYVNNTTHDPYVWNGTAWSKIITSSIPPVFPYTNTSFKINTGLFKIEVSGGGTTKLYSLVNGSNLTIGASYGGEIAFDVIFTTTPVTIYSWSLSVSNADIETNIMHAKFTNTGPLASSNKLKLFDGAGVALTTLNDSDYYISVTIFSD